MDLLWDEDRYVFIRKTFSVRATNRSFTLLLLTLLSKPYHSAAYGIKLSKCYQGLLQTFIEVLIILS